MSGAAAMRPIAKDTVHRLCSGQVIIDLSTAVKELLENSLDAGATSIDIKMKDSGLSSIVVTDNGQGIPSADYSVLCRKHWTSKISSFEDLEGIATFGFRGEALSSLCAVSAVVVTTATAETAPMGVQLEYGADGELLAQKPVARERGTTVQLVGLFAKWPVRLQDLKKNIRREFMRLAGLVEQYSIICDQVRLTLTNQSNKGASTVAVRTQPQSTRLSRLLAVFGTHTKPHIAHFDFTPAGDSCEGLDLRIEGHISKPLPEAGRSGSDKQYFFVNGRPCDFPKAKKLTNEMYRGYNPTRHPMFAIAIGINAETVDVNLTPDKRTILIRHETQLLAALREALMQVFEPSESTFKVNKVQTQLYRDSSDISTQSTVALTDAAADLATGVGREATLVDTETSSMEKSAALSIGRGEDSGIAMGAAVPMIAETSVPGVIRCSYAESRGSTASPGVAAAGAKRQSNQVPDLDPPPAAKQPQRIHQVREQPVMASNVVIVKPREQQEQQQERPMPNKKGGSRAAADSGTSTSTSTPKPPPAKKLSTVVIGMCRNRVQNIAQDWSNVRERLRQRQEQRMQEQEKSQQREAGLGQDLMAASGAEGGGIAVMDQEEASAALSRLIHKTDFSRMSIVGQFNRGFIIARLDSDMYIIDQHASDEKYNFEQLQQRSVIAAQPLIRPSTLELSVIDEGVAVEYKDVLMKNGFHIKVDENAMPGRRVSLLSQPFIDQTLFNQEDLMELIGKLCVNPESMPRCERARRMFASRACRKSTMIGDPLSVSQMKKIVGHLSELDHPWNCPHGRPTMRHLFHLPE